MGAAAVLPPRLCREAAMSVRSVCSSLILVCLIGACASEPRSPLRFSTGGGSTNRRAICANVGEARRAADQQRRATLFGTEPLLGRRAAKVARGCTRLAGPCSTVFRAPIFPRAFAASSTRAAKRRRASSRGGVTVAATGLRSGDPGRWHLRCRPSCCVARRPDPTAGALFYHKHQHSLAVA